MSGAEVHQCVHMDQTWATGERGLSEDHLNTVQETRLQRHEDLGQRWVVKPQFLTAEEGNVSGLWE